jgi:CheY-like chemotaxis protein
MDGNRAAKAIRDIEKETGGHVPILGVTANVRDAAMALVFPSLESK